jgi:hypothetical protein
MGKRLLEERKWGKLLLDNVLSNYQKFAQSLAEVEISKCNDRGRGSKYFLLTITSFL